MTVALVKSFAFGSKTAAAGTAITQVIPGKNNKVAKVTFLRYTSLGTAHTITAMAPQNNVKTTAIAAAGQAVITLASDPGIFVGKRTANNLIAISHFLILKYQDGTCLLVQVHALTAPVTNANGTVTVTLTANLAVSLPLGSTVYFMGAVGDTDPNTGELFQTILPPVSATTDYGVLGGGSASIVQATQVDDPLLITSNNITAAGILNVLSGLYGP